MKVIIAGSRGFNNYQLLHSVCNYMLQNQNNVEICSGNARGADLLGERYASEKGFNIKRFPAKWQTYGKSAGFIRNAEMVKHADALIAFWNGRSKGTKSIIDLARQHQLKIKVQIYT